MTRESSGDMRPARSWRAPALMLTCTVAALLAVSAPAAPAATSEDAYSGSDLWLRYVPVSDPELLDRYRDAVSGIVVENAARTEVYRHTPDLHMAPGSSEQLVETTLEAARDELAAFVDAWDAAMLPAPVAAVHLRTAVDALESLIGAVDVEDVLDRLFASFSVGK